MRTWIARICGVCMTTISWVEIPAGPDKAMAYPMTLCPACFEEMRGKIVQEEKPKPPEKGKKRKGTA